MCLRVNFELLCETKLYSNKTKKIPAIAGILYKNQELFFLAFFHFSF